MARLRALCEESIRSASFSSTCPLLCGSFFSRFPCLQSNWKSWRGEGQIAIPLLLIFLFAYAFPVLGSEWKTTEQFSANSNSSSFFPSLFILFYYVCASVCMWGVCGGVCISTFVRFPHSHFAFRIQCYSFNGIVKAELGWDAAGNFPNTRYLKDSHTHKWCCKARQCPSASPRPKSLPETKVLSELREKLVTFSLPRYLPHSNGGGGKEMVGGRGKRSLSQGFCT